MNTQRVDIFNKANSYHVALAVTHDLKLQLFPAENGLFDQYLTYERSLETSCTDSFKLFCIIYQTAACTAHCVCGTEAYGIAQLVSDLQRLFNRVCDLAASHGNSKAVHSFLEFDSVLATLDSIYLNADYLNIVLFKDTLLVKL